MPHQARNPFRNGKILQVFLILLACMATLGGAFFLAQLGPRSESKRSASADSVRQQQDLQELNRKSSNQWQTFANLKEFKKDLDAEDMKILEDALALREEYARQSDNLYDPTLEEIRKEWQNQKAAEWRAKSFELESSATKALRTDDFAEAEKFFAQAAALERRIRDECPLSNKRDIGRMASLEQQVRMMQARPLWNASIALEKEANALFEAKEWVKAAEKYDEAYTKEKLLRDKYLGLLPLEYARPNALLKRAETAKSAAANDAIETNVAKAETLAKLAKLDEAEAIFTRAIAAHEDLVKSYPNSKYAEKEAINTLLQRRSKALSDPVITTINDGIVVLDKLIREGKGDDAGKQALLLFQQATRLRDKFPDARLIDPEVTAKLQYISFKSRDIALVQDRFLALLKPIPGALGKRMTHSEIAQVLYIVIMENANPSATRGDTLPVDSVSYEEATEFCRRLAWLTGLSIRLPTEKEYRLALGKIDPASLAKQAWTIENSEGKTHPVATSNANANGFHDLLGNVSEWLLSEEKNPQAPEIGGDCQTSVDELASVPSAIKAKKDKSRLRGFRVVVVDDTGDNT